MHLLGQRVLGIAILCLLGLLVAVKQTSTGAILDKPKGNLLVQSVNTFNLLFLLVINPLTAILLIAERLPSSDPTHMTIHAGWLETVVEIVGLVLGLMGYFVMAWALSTLRHNYQLGGSTPRPDDTMVIAGPYRLIRHPMYGAALSIALGMALLIQSWAFVGVFVIYVALIIPLIFMEETALQKAYDGQYSEYQHKTRKLIPFVY